MLLYTSVPVIQKASHKHAQLVVPCNQHIYLYTRKRHVALVLKLHNESPHTGNCSFLLPPLAASSAFAMYGPTTGTLYANPAIVAKKSPNRTKMPYSSTQKPISGHRSRIRTIPAAKAAVPLSFCLRAKKAAVFCTPIMSVRPQRKRICSTIVSVRAEGAKRWWSCPASSSRSGLAIVKESVMTYISHCKHRPIEEQHHAAEEEEPACSMWYQSLVSSIISPNSIPLGIRCHPPPEQNATPISTLIHQLSGRAFYHGKGLTLGICKPHRRHREERIAQARRWLRKTRVRISGMTMYATADWAVLGPGNREGEQNCSS